MSEAKEELRKIYQRKEDTEGAVYIKAKDKTNIYDDNHVFRTCAYCRVSTDNDEQLSSFELQQQHYQNLVGAQKNWDLKKIFADEGISGTSLKNRDQFNEMIAACKRGEYDLIVTKSVSRFARNLVDCISLIRELKSLPHPVGVFFETDNLFTLSETSELKLSILATIAQEESAKKSEAMNWSLQVRFKNKKLLTPDLFGYRRPRDSAGHFIKYGPLIVQEDEAEIVKFIFNAFLGGYSEVEIAKVLSDIGVKTLSGNTNWSDGSIGYILRNERYCGDVKTWKTFTTDIFTHKHKKNNQDRDQYRFRNTHPAIITLEQFEAAQVLLENRRRGMRGGFPLMRVIDNGVFQGYVPINHRWANDDPNQYYQASNSIDTYNQPQRYRKSKFSNFDLTGYQVVRSTFLSSRTELPCINISKDKISFNTSAVRKFFDIPFIQLLLHPTERKMAIRPCNKNDSFSIYWRLKSEDPVNSKSINCPYFCTALYQIMDWNPDYTYRIIGTWIEKDNDKIIIFSLANAMPAVLIEPDEEDATARPKRVQICPEEWEDNFGDEFYRFSLDNKIYYDKTNEFVNPNECGKIIEGQVDFPICTDKELELSVEQLRIKAGEANG